jgi:hypothetical protein
MNEEDGSVYECYEAFCGYCRRPLFTATGVMSCPQPTCPNCGQGVPVIWGPVTIKGSRPFLGEGAWIR